MKTLTASLGVFCVLTDVCLWVCFSFVPSLLVGPESPVPWALLSFLIKGAGRGTYFSFFPTSSVLSCIPTFDFC